MYIKLVESLKTKGGVSSLALREIMGSVAAVFVGIYMLWFVIPVTKTAYNTELAHLNTTSTLMQTILPITNNWWLIFPLLIALLIGYTVWSYATDRNAFDY